MTQTYEETMEMKSIEVELTNKVQENEVDELLGDLNPRYFEEGYSLDEAKVRIQATQSYSNFSFKANGF